MRTVKYLFLCSLLVCFVVGIGMCLSPADTEGLQNMVHPPQQTTCPDLLLATADGILLMNTKSKAEPVRFSNLDEYIHFVESSDRKCPVLFVQQENNAQGQDVYSIRPSPFAMNGGTPTADASRENPPYNQNMYPGFDSHGQDIGTYDSLDAIHDSTRKAGVSDNPMDTNWGGVTFSQEAVLSGKYADNVVGKPTMVPKVFP